MVQEDFMIYDDLFKIPLIVCFFPKKKDASYL